MIIDARIGDIVPTRFMEGELVIPHFVLEELQSIADSAEPLRRARGRRGLECVDHLQASYDHVVIMDRDYHGLTEVDAKLIKLAKELDGRIITTDYNLNKVAQIQGVDVLNVNELANALKPVVLPGESLAVRVIREGKEEDQGVAYLDDGTMVVIEGGRRKRGTGRGGRGDLGAAEPLGQDGVHQAGVADGVPASGAHRGRRRLRPRWARAVPSSTCSLLGVPMLQRTVARAGFCDEVDALVVVVNPEDVEYCARE